MIPDLTQRHLNYHRRKIQALTPDSQRLWGQMTPEQMMHHLRLTIESTLENNQDAVKPVAPPVIRSIVAFVFFDLFTSWPKGKLKATPNLIANSVGAFNDERSQLLDVCDAFAARCDANPGDRLVHPLTGRTTLKRMAHLHGVHMNHHYKQFGLL